MDYVVLDSSGTDDDLPPTYEIGGPRVLYSGNGRSLAGANSQPRPHSKLGSDIHQIGQQAYAGVLRAFKMQSDDITWEKESLITELRRELKVSDEEHRVLLNKVNEEEAIRRIRKLRQGCSVGFHNHGPLKRQKKSRYSHSLPVGHQSPFTSLNAVASNKAYTMAPEDKRWRSGNQVLPNRGAWQAADGVMLPDRKSRRFHLNDDYALPNGFGAMDFNSIGVPLRDTSNIVKEVERILSHPDMYEIIKAKKLLRDHEQSLLDAIARLDEASDGESGELPRRCYALQRPVRCHCCLTCHASNH